MLKLQFLLINCENSSFSVAFCEVFKGFSGRFVNLSRIFWKIWRRRR